jgi:hypothetical protein
MGSTKTPAWLRSSDAIHRKVLGHNWDEGNDVIRRAIRSPNCDLATALCAYWRAGAGYYRQWRHASELPRGESQDTWRLVHEIERRIGEGFYAIRDIHFDPKTEAHRFYLDLSERFVRDLPDIVYQPTGKRGQRELDAELDSAARRGDVVLAADLIARGASVGPTSSDGSALHAAAARGQLAVVRLLIASGSDVSLRCDRDRTTPLHWASGAGHIEVVRALVEAGARVEAKDRWGTPLSRALKEGHDEVANYLRSHDAKR